MQTEARNINAQKSLNFFHLAIKIFYLLWHLIVAYVNGNKPVNHFLLRNIFKGQIFGSKFVHDHEQM